MDMARSCLTEDYRDSNAKEHTGELIINSLDLPIQCICFAKGLNEELGESVQGGVQMARADIKVVICVLLKIH